MRSAVSGLNWKPSQQIMNFEQYNCELISILLYKADNRHITRSPANLSELRTHAEYKPLNYALIFVRTNQNVHYKDDNFTSVYIRISFNYTNLQRNTRCRSDPVWGKILLFFKTSRSVLEAAQPVSQQVLQD